MKLYRIAAAVLSAVMVLSACTGKGGDYVGKVGNEKITKSEFEFYLASVKAQMQGTELTSDEDWATKEIEGKKAIDIAKERAFNTAVDNLSYIQVAEKLGLDMTDDEKKLTESYKEYLINSTGGEDSYKKFLEEKGITDEFIDMMCRSLGYNEKLIDKVESDSPVTDEELTDYMMKHYRRAKHILIMTIDQGTGAALDDEKKAEAKKTAEDILKRAQSGENFEALIDEFNQDPGMKSNPDGYVFTDGTMVQEFTDGVDSLKPGEITMVETSYGYHIIKRYALDESPEYTAQALESVRSEVEHAINTEKLNDQIDVWRTEFGINVEKNDPVYDTITN